jgi:DNA polymerase-3 subunit epsilon
LIQIKQDKFILTLSEANNFIKILNYQAGTGLSCRKYDYPAGNNKPAFRVWDRMNRKIVAIDFETANEMMSSACALGIAIVDGNKITAVRHWLIKPPELRFNYFNSRLHGITAKDVEKKPEFYRIWPSIKKYLEGNIIIAHNAGFDMAVLKSVLRVYQIEIPELHYACTVRLSRKVWKGFDNYRLNTVAENLEISFRHHNAREDACACANIAIAAAEKLETGSFFELIEKLELKINQLVEI